MNTLASLIVDTGPLVALCNRQDDAFAACAGALRLVPHRARVITTVACVTEAMYQLSRVPGGADNLMSLLISGRFGLDCPGSSSLPRVREFLHQYADLPMDFADATVVDLAERTSADAVFTPDEQDFRVYRLRHAAHFRLLPTDF